VPKRYSAELSFGLSRKHLTRLEKLARSKRSSLFVLVISKEGKKFYNIGPRFPPKRVNHFHQQSLDEALEMRNLTMEEEKEYAQVQNNILIF
jgi:hypothetical protein